ncbi:MAG: hypothetical protein Q9227_006951 [Pyrenula ochraceoflavens]
MSVPSNPLRAVPLSPASPPSDGLKETKPFYQSSLKHPRSPQSPSTATFSSMNIVTHNHDPAHNLQQTSPTDAATYPQSSSTPSTVQSLVQQSNSTSNGMTWSETPASSVDAPMNDLQISPSKERFAPEASQEISNAAKRDASEMTGFENMDDGAPPSKRPRTGETRQEEETEAIQAAHPRTMSGLTSFDEVQKDMGTTFLLCRKPPAQQPPRPDPSQSFMSLYGLIPLVSTVARDDPNNPGEKLNKLRKSYDGQIKDFGLAGRNKSVRKEPDAQGRVAGGLNEMLAWPEHEWHLQKVNAKPIRIGDELEVKLNHALKLEPGIPRNHRDWEDKLGHEKMGARPQPAGESKKVTPNTVTARANGVVAPMQSPGEANRPRRVKKRSYQDNSFAGYGEGFIDDQDEQPLSGEDDGSRGIGRKRRKKDSFTTASPVTMEGGIRASALGMNR